MATKSFKNTLLILAVSCSLMVYFFVTPNNNTINTHRYASYSAMEKVIRAIGDATEIETWSKMRERSKNNLSILGEWLKAPEDTPPPPPSEFALSLVDKTPEHRPLILVWKHGPFLERRHVRRFADERSGNKSDELLSLPWQGCSVSNCILSYREQDLSAADAVVFHLHLTRGAQDLPPAKGKLGQIWIFLSDESPLHTFLYASENRDVSVYDGIFDWSMTYREDSDVPVAYGRTIARATSGGRTNYRSGKTRLVAILGSNCSQGKNQRLKYVRELRDSLSGRLDIYGACLGGNRTACPGHFRRDCPILSSYKFYLAFENSNCREYITEKVFWNAYAKGSVPIIMGAPRIDCERLLPPRSFIHVDDFTDSRDLSDYIIHLDNNDDAYDAYHQWRSTHILLNEHGYFGSPSKHYCRVCEALRYNSKPPTVSKYRRFGDYINATRDCYPYH